MERRHAVHRLPCRLCRRGTVLHSVRSAAGTRRGRYRAPGTGEGKAGAGARSPAGRTPRGTGSGGAPSRNPAGPAPAAIDRCREILRRHGGHPAVRVAVECPLAALLAVRGDTDEARGMLDAAERTVRDLGHVYALATVPLFLGTVEIAAGRPA